MTPTALIARLLTAGFDFYLTAEGGASFRRPVADGPEVDELLAIAGWCWGTLEPAVRQHLTAQNPATELFSPPAGSASAG